MKTAILLLTFAMAAAAKQPLLVISVDGLDQRYLTNRDQMGLKIPNIRRLLREGQFSAGVVGVMPTVTWPSHTTMLTGVEPEVHGILNNKRPASEGGDYPWSVSLLKARTLLEAAHDAGLKTATVTWPVTVDAPVTFNLPEYFQKRNGGAMDTQSIGSKSNPHDLVQRITRMFPSFPQVWMNDRTRTQAIVYLLKTEKPDLLLVHLVDLDSEQHETGPFSTESKALVELSDEYVGQMMAALPGGYAVALVSDHGFERVDQDVNLTAMAAKQGITGVVSRGGIAVSQSAEATAFLKKAMGVGREIPKEELRRFSPDLLKADAVFEPGPGYWFGSGVAGGEVFSKPHASGNHGHWPMRYRAVYGVWGSGIKAASLPEFSQKEIAGKFAEIIGVSFTPGAK